MTEKRRARLPRTTPPDQLRTRTVSARLTDAELADLDARRGPYQRGTYMRLAAFDRLPHTIPAVNVTAWTELARAAANLNQIAKSLNAGDAADAAQIRSELADFRRALIGAKP